jgi:hypothetical protein
MNDNSPQMLRSQPTQGDELMRLHKENLDLKAEQNALIIRAFADWANDVAAQLIAFKSLLQSLGVTEQRLQQSVDEAKRSLPQGPQSSLPALAELMSRLSEQ